MSRVAHLLLVAAALGGCGLSRPPVEPARYVMAAPADSASAAATKPVAVRVRPLRIDSVYDGKAFVYRIDGAQLATDFYNEFADAPETMVTAAVIASLKGAGLFKAVIEPGAPIDAPYALDGKIVALYGDFRDAAKPVAVLGVQFYLLRNGADGREIVLDRLLEERVAVSARTASAVAQGYNEALARILARLEKELAALELGTK
jgi:cholesterol transport system auxiliary component